MPETRTGISIGAEIFLGLLLSLYTRCFFGLHATIRRRLIFSSSTCIAFRDSRNYITSFRSGYLSIMVYRRAHRLYTSKHLSDLTTAIADYGIEFPSSPPLVPPRLPISHYPRGIYTPKRIKTNATQRHPIASPLSHLKPAPIAVLVLPPIGRDCRP